MFRVLRAQAGLEYLMTYGWALVLIVTVASVLFFVFSPSASTTNFSSSDPTKILLRASNVSGSAAEIQLQNATGGKINITNITPTGYSNCTVNGSASSISVGSGNIMKLNCIAPSDNKGSIKIDYTDYAGLQRTVIINGSGTGGTFTASLTETLRPNGAGSETSIPGQYPSSGSHYDKVMEVTPDEDNTTLSSTASTWPRDLYALPDHTGSGTINSVTVYARLRQLGSAGSGKISISTEGTTYDTGAYTLTSSYTDYSNIWATNPNTSTAWTWAEIDALQAGISLYGTPFIYPSTPPHLDIAPRSTLWWIIRRASTQA